MTRADKDGESSTIVDDDGNAKIFPQRLMEILNDPKNHDSIAWLPHGKAFKVIDRNKLANEVLPKYFRKSKYNSFTRKLNRWNFTRVAKGPEMGSYHHEYFRRDNEALCTQMYYKSERSKFAISNAEPATTNKDDSNKKDDEDEDEDDFDDMRETAVQPNDQQNSVAPLAASAAYPSTMARQSDGSSRVDQRRLSSSTAATNNDNNNNGRSDSTTNAPPSTMEQARQMLLQAKQLLSDSGTNEIARSLVEITLRTLRVEAQHAASKRNGRRRSG